MTADLNRPNLQDKQSTPRTTDQKKARKLFERSLQLDIFNVGAYLRGTASE